MVGSGDDLYLQDAHYADMNDDQLIRSLGRARGCAAFSYFAAIFCGSKCNSKSLKTKLQ
jgi:hypothetical protein